MLWTKVNQKPSARTTTLKRCHCEHALGMNIQKKRGRLKDMPSISLHDMIPSRQREKNNIGMKNAVNVLVVNMYVPFPFRSNSKCKQP